ncbi:MAG: trypsin-like peptidase domain-containing protein [Bdellovibrionales bacterium]|nr:trypsin-like peptidase domain-containing protein [Bdellovibrionales bacterium]
MKSWLACILALLTSTGVFLSAQSPTATLPKLKAGDPLPANLFVELAKAVNPAVVNIFTTYLPRGRQPMPGPQARDPFFDLFEQFMGPQPYGGGGPRAMPQQSLGTGFVIREDGLIITNNHVVDKADVVKVQLEERTKEQFDAKVIGTDPRTDVALIKIETKKKLPFLRLGSSAEVQVGEWVAAFGNPYGYGHSMTKGIISAIGREIDELNLNPFMQTDASINPGNSGGPLVNTQGQVIGVNTAIDARAQGIGFVIPIDNVKAILPTLEKEGTIKRGFLGVQLDDIDEEDARSLNIKQSEGTLVTQVIAGTAAEKAGLEAYDLITEFDGKKISSSAELRKQVSLTPVGKSVSVNVIRNGKPKALKVAIGGPPDPNAMKPSRGQGSKALGTKVPGLGFAVGDYSSAIAQEYNLPKLRSPKPVILAVDPSGEAARAGLAPGDIILDLNRTETVRARDVLAGVRKGTINILRVLKQDRVVLVSLRAP